MRVMREMENQSQDRENASIYWLYALIAQTIWDKLEPDTVLESISSDQQQ